MHKFFFSLGANELVRSVEANNIIDARRKMSEAYPGWHLTYLYVEI